MNPQARPSAGGRRSTARQGWIGYLFASPWLAGFVCLTALPMVASLLLSFCEWNGINLAPRKVIPSDIPGGKPKETGIKWVGLKNYAEAGRGIANGVRSSLNLPVKTDRPGDENVWIALKNTFYYAFLAVPLGLAVSLMMAVLLNQKLRGINLFRTLFYMPHIIGGVATIMMWMYVFNPQFGLLNAMLRSAATPLMKLGLVDAAWQGPGWLWDARWSKPALIIMSLWGAGGAMLIFLAALQNVPEQLYEAARIDGASRFRQFLHVTLPQISPAIFFNLVMGIIGSFQVFNEAYIVTGGEGGEAKSLLFYVLYLYNKAFRHFELGYASALAWILFAIILAFTLLVIRSSSAWVYYEGEQQ